MKLFCLFAQRKCTYAGQYGIECWESMTEYEYDDNPNYLLDRRIKYLESGEFEAVEPISIDIKEEEILNILFPRGNIKIEFINKKQCIRKL